MVGLNRCARLSMQDGKKEEERAELETSGHERRREETSSSPIERRKTQDDRAFDFENLLGILYELSILGCTKSRLEEREWSWRGDERRSRTSPFPLSLSLATNAHPPSLRLWHHHHPHHRHLQPRYHRLLNPGELSPSSTRRMSRTLRT